MNNNSVVDYSTVLQLFNLDEDKVESFEYKNINGNAGLFIQLKRRNDPCPRCGCPNPGIKEYQLKQVRHDSFTDRSCILYYNARRYICPVCLRTYYEHNPFVFKRQKISALTVMNVLEDLKSPSETFTTVADRHHISPTTAASIFDSHVEMPVLKLPERINVDECYAFSGNEGKYVLMILDDSTGDPVDILPSRRKEYLLDYFRKIPYAEREKVKFLSTDMYETYRQVANLVFPECLICADHFHVSKEFFRQAEKIRIRVMNRYAERDRLAKKDKKMLKNDSSDEYYLLKHYHWMFYKHSDAKDKHGFIFDPKRKKRYNKHFNMLLNYADLLELFLAIDDDLTEAHDLKEKFNDFYALNTYDTAEKALRILIKDFRSSSQPEMKEFSKTLANWSVEIVNSFIIVDNEYIVQKDTGAVTVHPKHMSSATIERKNGILKLIKKAGCGYRNWDRFRNRCLYVLRKDATYHLNPIDQPKARKFYEKKKEKNHD